MRTPLNESFANGSAAAPLHALLDNMNRSTFQQTWPYACGVSARQDAT